MSKYPCGGGIKHDVEVPVCNLDDCKQKCSRCGFNPMIAHERLKQSSWEVFTAKRGRKKVMMERMKIPEWLAQELPGVKCE